MGYKAFTMIPMYLLFLFMNREKPCFLGQPDLRMKPEEAQEKDSI